MEDEENLSLVLHSCAEENLSMTTCGAYILSQPDDLPEGQELPMCDTCYVAEWETLGGRGPMAPIVVGPAIGPAGTAMKGRIS